MWKQRYVFTKWAQEQHGFLSDRFQQKSKDKKMETFLYDIIMH